ncbi:MAG: hypothetical protein DMG14_02905 [Acidobacteria bacterium]|nr:MAG: hypothetical protein DMG14_02905 [Acidobacteriota bacterium]
MKWLATSSLLLIALASLLAAQSLTARLDGDQLRIAAPRLHFLLGEALNRLHDGATVKYQFQLTTRADRSGTVLARAQEQFAISYDLWEEKFAVTKIGSPSRSISHLSAAAAETWCVDNMTIPVAALNANQPFWIRLDYRADQATAAADPQDNSGFTLSGLIDIFSRRTRNEQLHGSEEVGPLRLENLKKK